MQELKSIPLSNTVILSDDFEKLSNLVPLSSNEQNDVSLRTDDWGNKCLSAIFSEDNKIATDWRGKKAVTANYTIVSGESDPTNPIVNKIVLSSNVIYNYYVNKLEVGGTQTQPSCEIVYWPENDDKKSSGECILNLKIDASNSSAMPQMTISSDPNILLHTWSGDDITEIAEVDPTYYMFMMFDTRLSSTNIDGSVNKRIIHIVKKSVSDVELN